MGRLGAGSHARMVVRRRDIGGASVVQAVHQREVPLGAVSRRLKGRRRLRTRGRPRGRLRLRARPCSAPCPRRARPRTRSTSYVDSLVAHDRIDYGGRPRRTVGRVSWHSHAVRSDRRTSGPHPHLLRLRRLARLRRRDRSPVLRPAENRLRTSRRWPWASRSMAWVAPASDASEPLAICSVGLESRHVARGLGQGLAVGGGGNET